MAETPRFTRPQDVWELMTREERRQAAEAFWQGGGPDEQARAELLLAERLKFRPRSVHAMPLARKSEYLTALVLPYVPEVLERALVSYHLQERHELLGAFLDALNIPHERGEIKSEGPIAPPTPEALQAAHAAVAGRFPAHDVQVYFATLLVADPETWQGLAALLASDAGSPAG